jgi:tRNA (cmo5U34)-methyltransferase
MTTTKSTESPGRAQEDKLFAEPRRRVDDFNFGKETAAVFDDMVSRSVPGYAEIQRMVGELVSDYAAPGTNIYDLGCATGTTFLAVHPGLPRDLPVRFVGLDSSQSMLDEARQKLQAAGFPFQVELRQGDLNLGAAVKNASVVMMILTLQFVRPLNRARLLGDIYCGLNENGCLILVEKVLGEHSTFNRLFIRYYYDYKRRNGYSEMEIAQKREALENVLVPYRLEENREMLRLAGFQQTDVFFKWYNFCGMIAMK